jgi:aminoglycoside phosphotransferase family enzyme/predicted kinase
MAMAAGQQSDVIAFLADPETFGVSSVERVDTHASIVFLAGTRAYKLKRAVRYDYLDFSTLERRHAMCLAELRLNQRAAPAIYRRVVAITREQGGHLALDGAGPAVEWLIEMTRFDQDLLLDRLATEGRLDVGVMPALADAVTQFHASAVRRQDRGGVAGLSWVIDGNAHAIAAEASGVLDPEVGGRVTARARETTDRHRALLERRRLEGLVRECHGDLHLRNIVLLAGRPTLFDAVEFNDDISVIDILYDTAFLLMDLWQRGLRRHACLLWNRFLSVEPDFEGVPLLPLFLSCRAAVRAKTSATAAALEPEDQRRSGLEASARRYLTLAESLLAPPAPRLAAIGGLSGTGKSTVAMALAPGLGAAPGAVVLRSDEIRKALLGFSPTAHPGAAAYTPSMSRRVYAEIRRRARLVLEGGLSVVADAVFADPAEREAIERIAAEVGAPFTGVWLEAPLPLLETRVRERTDDASDADVSVLRTQAAQGVGGVGWERLDASTSRDMVATRVRALLGADDPAAA